MGMKKEYLRHAVIELTSDCNLQCKHCYNWWKQAGVRAERYNSYRKAFTLLDYLIRKTTLERVVFSGGEPTIGERFEELVLHAKVNGLSVTVITNGNGDPAIYERLVALKVDLVELSILSFRPEVHDAITGVRGSWEKTMATLRFLLEKGLKVVPVMVVTRANYLDVEKCVEELFRMGIRGFMVNRYNIGGEGLNQEKSLSVGKEELREVFAKVDALAERFGLHVTSGVCTPYCLLDAGDYPHVRFGSCSTEVYRRPLTFDIAGNIRMCNHSPRVVGNIYRQTLSEILFSDYACSWADVEAADCRGCLKWSVCRGGCRAAAEQMGNTLDRVDPIVKELSLKPFLNTLL